MYVLDFMDSLLVTLMPLLAIVVNYGKVVRSTCPAGCRCSLPFINCCESEGYFEIPISGFDNVTKLSLSGCPRLVIARQSIWTLKALEDITIKRTPVAYIDEYAFTDLPKLKNLVLNELNLSMRNLHPAAFTDLPVQQLDLKNNNLKIIHSQMFRGLKNLRILDLSKNKIAIIHNQAFESLHLLSLLNLEDNNLISVTPYWFKPFRNYSSLRINLLGNNLTHECSFRGIDLLENQWFKKSLWRNKSIDTVTNLPTCSLPVFSDPYQDVYVMESASVMLSCSPSGTPRPVLTWFLPSGLEVIPSSFLFSVTSGKLTIPNAKLSHSGIYACAASNSEGSSVALTRLSVIPNTTMMTTADTTVTETPKKKASFVLLVVFIILLCLVLAFVLGYISRLIYKLAKKSDDDNFEFSHFVDTPNILPIPENPQPMPHV